RPPVRSGSPRSATVPVPGRWLPDPRRRGSMRRAPCHRRCRRSSRGTRGARGDEYTFGPRQRWEAGLSQGARRVLPMHLSNTVLSVLAIAALAVAVLSFAYAFALAARLRRPIAASDAPIEEHLGAVTEAQRRSIQRLVGAVVQLAGSEKHLGDSLR